MKRESALLTWWYLTIGGIVTVLAAALPPASWREEMYLVAGVQLAVSYTHLRAHEPLLDLELRLLLENKKHKPA